MNNLRAEEVPEHHPGKEPMADEADGSANLRELTRCTEQLDDVIDAV